MTSLLETHLKGAELGGMPVLIVNLTGYIEEAAVATLNMRLGSGSSPKREDLAYLSVHLLDAA